ncbi:hypothetical protein [Limnoglobus roseus]|nr:hypothetical protein [Limnoglobus roseus]
MDVLSGIVAQIKSAKRDLDKYQPHEVDWNQHAVAAAEELVPWLSTVVHGMKDYVQDVLNAPALLRSLWGTIRKHVDLPTEQIEAFDRQLTLDDVLRESVTGEVISNVVTKYLIEHHPTASLKSNGRSDYPDLFLSDRDYTLLPVFKRIKKIPLKEGKAEEQYGASIKGSHKRPVRIPDGLEIKTCRDRIAVDCHHPHAGLHLILLFSHSKRIFNVSDVRIGFLRHEDYRESNRNTTATTVKYSFNGDRFLSLLSSS